MYKDNNGVWRFSDNDEPTAETWADRPCGICGKFGNSNAGKPDPCLGQLPGVTNACCGHGNRDEAYVVFEGGVVLRGFIIERHNATRSDSFGDADGCNNSNKGK